MSAAAANIVRLKKDKSVSKIVKIGDFKIGENRPTHVIAEIGGNFTDFDGAKKLIDLAMGCGADSVKLQTYQAETIASRKARYDMPNTGNASQFDLFKLYEVDFALHKDIWDYCAEQGILIFSTPSHMSDVELLEKLDCAVYKIGSDDACNIPFLKEVARVGKPIILSTGMCTMTEVEESVAAILEEGLADLILLHCVTNYPCQESAVNLKCIPAMQQKFGLPVGWSDHTLTTLASEVAVALGAHVVERHFTYNRDADGPDHVLSVDTDGMRRLVDNIRRIEVALGDGIKRPSHDERTTRINNRKSLIAGAPIKAGEVIGKERLAIKRPGSGIPPKHFDEVTSRVAARDLDADDIITWDALA